MAKDLERGIRMLHSRVTKVVKVEMSERGLIRWTVTTSGEDFLDGDWTREISGFARSWGKVRRQIRKEV